MNDFLSGVATEADVIKLRDHLITILVAAKMELEKWYSGDLSILNVFKNTETEKENVHELNDLFTKILGMY